jgi:hypothetical protein
MALAITVTLDEELPDAAPAYVKARTGLLYSRACQWAESSSAGSFPVICSQKERCKNDPANCSRLEV